MKQNGEILDCTYCEESWTVSFYFDEKTVWLYVPQIRWLYSGSDAECFSVASVESLGWLDDTVITGFDQLSKFRITGARESADLIYKTLDRYSTHNDIGRDTWKSMDDVAAWMQSLAENTRAILWRGHGTVYRTRNGELVSVWFLTIKRSKNAEKYQDGDDSLVFSRDNYCAITSNFWKKYCPVIDDGIFITGSCSTGADGGTTAKILFDKGFSAYAAPNGGIFTTYSDKMLGRITEYMCGNVDGIKYNINDALEKAKTDIGETDIYGVSIVCTNADLGNPFRLIPKGEDIPSEAVEFNGHHYYIYDIDSIRDWDKAQVFCEEQGGYLATITTAEEDSFIYFYIASKGCYSAWFGLTDKDTRDVWTWVTGEAFEYSNWHPGEPNHEGGYEHYGMYYGRNRDGTWNDGGNITGPFICEWSK